MDGCVAVAVAVTEAVAEINPSTINPWGVPKQVLPISLGAISFRIFGYEKILNKIGPNKNDGSFQNLEIALYRAQRSEFIWTPPGGYGPRHENEALLRIQDLFFLEPPTDKVVLQQTVKNDEKNNIFVLIQVFPMSKSFLNRWVPSA